MIHPTLQVASELARISGSRRDALRVGGLALLGLSLPQFLAATEDAARRPRARSVIFYHHYGAPSHIDTFDPKAKASNPHSPGDMAATIFWALGLDPHAEIHDQLGRPYKLADGEPIEALFA